MTKWIPCSGGFIEADVVRWTEGVWERRSRRKNARATNVGERLVTGEVIREDAEGWVFILVRDCAMVSEKTGRKVSLLAKGEEIRRRPKTISRGRAERLPWSDESARANLASRFLGKGIET